MYSTTRKLVHVTIEKPTYFVIAEPKLVKVELKRQLAVIEEQIKGVKGEYSPSKDEPNRQLAVIEEPIKGVKGEYSPSKDESLCTLSSESDRDYVIIGDFYIKEDFIV